MLRRLLPTQSIVPLWVGLLFTLAALVLLASLLFTRHSALASSDIGLLAIDGTSTGNTTTSCSGEGCTPGTLGTREGCAYTVTGGVVTVDLVVDGIPSAVGPSGVGPNVRGFDLDLIYNPTVMEVFNVDMSLGMQYAGSPTGGHSSGTDPLPDSDGDFHISETDLGPTGESGKGILVRLTLQGVSQGFSTISLQHTASSGPPRIFDNTGNPNSYTIETIPPFIFFVGTFCPSTPTPSPPPTWTPSPGDTDGDSVQDVSDNCPRWYNPAQGLPNWPVPTDDADCDGFRDTVGGTNSAPETYIGTDPVLHCAQTQGVNNDPLPDVWPADFNDDRIANGQDTGKYGGVGGSFNHPVSDGPFNGIPGERFDFSGNGIINGQDTGKYQAYFNKVCMLANP